MQNKEEYYTQTGNTMEHPAPLPDSTTITQCFCYGNDKRTQDDDLSEAFYTFAERVLTFCLSITRWHSPAIVSQLS
ncbi:MAG: hypothetical protein OHK0046_08790 [Anaerolineae bacterium]